MNSLALCVDKAIAAFRSAGLSGEVIVADNGSTDGSIEIADSHGARVVRVAERGYGAALRAGIANSRGSFIVMGDADDSYDFSEVPRFVQKWREGLRRGHGQSLPRRQSRRHALAPQIHWQSRPHRLC